MPPIHPSLPDTKEKHFKPARQKRLAVVLPILLLLGMAIWLRIYRLEVYPIQMNADELSNLYDAWSIAQTGADRWGMPYPVILRGFGTGDNRPPLYAWLSAGLIQVAGYSIWAGRFPSVVLGLLSLALVYLTARKLGGRLFAFLALLSAAFSPWHLHFSRLASEGAMLPAFFVLLALYGWICTREKHYPLPGLMCTGLIFGLGTSTYQATKLIFFLLALLLMADLLLHSGRSYKKVLLFGCCCLLGAAPQLLAMLWMPERFLARAHDTLMPFSFTFYYVSNVLRNVFANLSPDFLFFSFSDYNYETNGRLLPVEFPFFYLGLFHLGKVFRRPYRFPPFYFYLLLFIVIFPAALTDANPNALRTSCLIVLLPLVSAAGMVYVWQQLPGLQWQRAFLAASVLLVVANSLYFVSEYASSAVMQHNRQQHFLVLLAKRINQYKDRYSRVYLEYMGNQPYIYIAHYCRIPPRQFQQMPKKVMETADWDYVRQTGKYYFLRRAELHKQVAAYPHKSLVVLPDRHAPYRLIDSLEAFGSKKIYFFESKNMTGK